MPKDILSSNFFELFELPVSYDVDLNKVQQHYMALQKEVHPDKYTGATDQEKRLSMQQTSWINEAQATLKDPVARATYLLKLKGVDINLENETTMDAGFLMQQLEVRERLENIKQENDPLDSLEQMSKELKSASDDMMKSFAQAYEAGEIDESREWIRKLQFMHKAIKQINTLSADLEDELMG
ncbi:MAG: Fe-S protein assembly co-chaperone HscB [Gammaproteobacteria bacterium]|nr:Fe-S protein assembly co-chaperone HscB [Gammaproteobacteria bacterium]MBT8135320.1 Fe-S protein assembly co-chaperone HscB [Gammaproteobacteria bacterium]NNJ49265.1 Fe-S protein assembly co-chaperone HscB [Gammaproteobacteria bacterium]